MAELFFEKIRFFLSTTFLLKKDFAFQFIKNAQFKELSLFIRSLLNILKKTSAMQMFRFDSDFFF